MPRRRDTTKLDGITVEDQDFAITKHIDREACPICRSGAIGIKRMRDYQTRSDLTIRDLALEFNMTEEEVADHISNHVLEVKLEVTKTGELRKRVSSPDFYLDELATLYMAIRDCFESINIDKDNYDSVKIDHMTKLSKEIRENLKIMAELQGRLKGSGDVQQKIVKVEGNFNLIMDILSGGTLCPHCEEKVMKRLDDVEHLIQ